MKAFVIKKGSSTLEGITAVEVDRPVAGPHDILVEMKAAAINFRDLMIAQGVYFGGPVNRDIVALSDGAGEVVAVGDSVSRFKVGDRVSGTFFRNYVDGPPQPVAGSSLGSPIDGTLCEFMAINERDAVRIPRNLSFIEAATLPCAGVTAWHALMVAGKPLQPGQTVLTLGTGGVSIFALQFAVASGATVISTSSSDDKLARARTLGARHTINYKSTPEWHEEVMKLTDGRGVDCVVEVGGSGTLSRSMQSLGFGGKIAIIGVLASEEGDTNPRGVMLKGGNLHGIFVGNRAMFENMNRAIEANDIHPVIDRVFSFDEAPEAYAYMQSQAHFGKVVISFQ